MPTTRRPSPLAKFLLPIIFIVLGVGSLLYLNSNKAAVPAKPVKEKIWRVKVQQAEFSPGQPELTLFGKVESPLSSNLTAPLTAYVSQRLVAEGNRVTQGQVLVKLDDRDARLLLDQRNAEVQRIEAQIGAEDVRYAADQKALKIEQELLTISQRTLDRYQNLSSQQVASQNQLDDARRTRQQQALSLNNRRQAIADHPNRLAQLNAQLLQAKALQASAALDVERSEIKAPFDGRITRLDAAPGDRVRGGDQILSMYSDKDLEIRAQLPNQYLNEIRSQLAQQPGIPATGQLNGQNIPLTLDRIAAEANATRPGVDALFSVTQQDQILEPGRSLAMTLTLPPVARSLIIPPQALYGTSRIYRITDGRLEALKVQRIGDTSVNGQAGILITASNLQEGDNILVTQLPNAISGLRVEAAE